MENLTDRIRALMPRMVNIVTDIKQDRHYEYSTRTGSMAAGFPTREY